MKTSVGSQTFAGRRSLPRAARANFKKVELRTGALGEKIVEDVCRGTSRFYSAPNETRRKENDVGLPILQRFRKHWMTQSPDKQWWKRSSVPACFATATFQRSDQ